VKKMKGESVMKKIHLVAGDVAAPKLGLSDDDRAMLAEETEFIFHGAATIRFDEALRTAVLLNVRGTKLMLELAKECKRLVVFCHLSTAYCHLNERILYEKMYPPPADPESVIRTCEMMSNDVINSITDKSVT
jgi:fatty acyl-CoA reductase